MSHVFTRWHCDGGHDGGVAFITRLISSRQRKQRRSVAAIAAGESRCRFLKAIGPVLVLLSADSGAASAESLYATVAERLSLMRDVAAYKWLHELPVEDRQRELRVIDSARVQALQAGIRPATAEVFFAQQIAAAKDIQRFWFVQWANGAGPTAAPNLQSDLRPRLLELGRQIVSGLGVVRTHDKTLFREQVRLDGLEQQRITQLYRSLINVTRYRDRLEQIVETGRLRVGTTGDYAPFSHSPAHTASSQPLPGGPSSTEREVPNTAFTGIDIVLAKDLAQSLSVEIEFVQTSWQTLTRDLLDGRFDIAMSGVSRTLERASVGHLSVPYYAGGKMPIARCSDGERFSSLSAIDRPGVRVIVNPGGTNERYVDDHLHHATKVLHPDNRTIFSALIDGKADLMITDRVEVRWQVRNNPELCSTMKQTLTYQEKAYFMPADPVLKAYVDTWLSLRLADGTVSALLEQYLQ